MAILQAVVLVHCSDSCNPGLQCQFNAWELGSALFVFQDFLTVVLLIICTCTYIKIHFPKILDHRTGFRGFFWKAARIGERLSPWVAACCLLMGLRILFF
ncbi:unnamed protein product [Sphagnum compactum]